MYIKTNSDEYYSYYDSEIKIETALGVAERMICVRTNQKINQEMIKDMDLFSDNIVKEEKSILSEIHIDYKAYEQDDELGDVPKGLSVSQMKDYISNILIFINFGENNEYCITVTPDWDEEHRPTYIRVNGIWDRTNI